MANGRAQFIAAAILMLCATLADSRLLPGARAQTTERDIARMLPPDSIGVAWMEPDGTIRMNLRAEGPGGIVGHGRLEYAPGDKDYAKILAHLGGLKPGQFKSVPPWPK